MRSPEWLPVVPLRAGSASLHWHRSRHGQPSVIAERSARKEPLQSMVEVHEVGGDDQLAGHGHWIHRSPDH